MRNSSELANKPPIDINSHTKAEYEINKSTRFNNMVLNNSIHNEIERTNKDKTRAEFQAKTQNKSKMNSKVVSCQYWNRFK